MKRLAITLVTVAILLVPGAARAGFTQTLPQYAMLLEVFYATSFLDSLYDDHGGKVPLLEDTERYEPGGSLQGILSAEAEVRAQILAVQAQFGVLDDLSVGIGLPIILSQKVEPNLRWQEGDYQWLLGRAYTESDFWQWAATMGQPKPGDWEGNKNTLGDLILAARWRFTDRFSAFAKLRENAISMALFVFGALPTGSKKDPEELTAVGTTSWDLHAQGELGMHVSIEKRFPKSTDDRLAIGLDLFYEIFFPHEYDTPTGKKHPLLSTYSPYVGRTYTLDPGDFMGFSVQADVVAYRGPALKVWLAGNDVEKAAKLPPILSFSLRYTFNYLFQSNWTSESHQWDEDQERAWRPGYKNILMAKMSVSLLRVGVPIMPYVTYRNLTWIPGKNSRAVDVIVAGIQIPLSFKKGGM